MRRPPAPDGQLNTPCHACPKVPTEAPERHWRHALDLSDRNLRVLAHYRECQAVGQWPDDRLVRRHAAIIRQIEDRHREHGGLAAKLDLLIALLTRAGGRDGRRS